MMNFQSRWLFVVSLVAFTIAPPVLALEEPVSLTSGQVSGLALEDGLRVYRGIPFAAPPVGDLRWQEPQPPIPWHGVREATAFGPACMQAAAPGFMEAGLMSEDCLYLNVWTAAESPADARPVMVWIHGGGWGIGASSQAVYDGAALAAKGVVLVSVNYRMNAFGFMAHPALSAESERRVSGNYGILDHIAALEWVRDNIAAFGGNPDNVTIFGESAGGASVYALLATPLSDGLFHRAISESTWITSTNVTHLTRANGFSESAEALGETAITAALTELDRPIDNDLLTTMRGLSADEVMGLTHRVTLVEDGWLLPQSPAEIFRSGSHRPVPLLAGVNDGEGLLFLRPDNVFQTVEEQRTAREAEWGEHGSELAAYYVAPTSDDIFTTEVDYNTDAWFARGTREILDAMSRTSTGTFMYLFTRNLQDPSERSPHFMEVQYVFQNLPEEAPEVDEAIADLMSDYWVQFSTTGNPNREGLPEWPAYDVENRQHQVIDTEVGQGREFRQQALDALDRYFSATYSSAGGQ